MDEYHIFTDESRQTQEQYMLLGGLIVLSEDVPLIDEAISDFRIQHQMDRTLKWGKVSASKLPEYKNFVDIFFEFSSQNRLFFQCLIVDSRKLDHATYNYGNGELGYYKFYYQLMLNCFGKNFNFRGQQYACFRVFPDWRTTPRMLSNCQEILNKGMAKRFGDHNNPFASIEPRSTREENLLQLNDILLGAVGYHKNSLHLRSNASKARCELADHIARRAGYPILGEPTRFGDKRFHIWNFQSSKNSGSVSAPSNEPKEFRRRALLAERAVL